MRPSRTTRAAGIDEASFDALFRESVGDVHGYSLSLLGDAAAAEDVTALAFERLYRARGRVDPRRGSARGLLFTIARNAALDELRRRRSGRIASEAAAELLASEPVAGAEEDVARRESVRRALAALPLRDREIVLLKFHGQLSNGELARALGISESNAGTRLSRALAKLREGELGVEGEEVA
ncbi:MAG TPA: sigma-70 family RNA polymerase sigma factor [Solirubrobacteraceae bacterium]|nr:sigma-70 family RNA polymerase sigma factor [Solirubrobacteraceae bacterium]